MGFFGRIKCLAGRHSFGNWSEPSAVDCSQVSKCRWCSKSRLHHAPHDWSEPSFVAGKCRLQQVCRRCHGVNAWGVEHQWSDWSPGGDSQCHFVRQCTRCEEVEFKEEHPWDVWKHDSPTSCDQVRFCRRCYKVKQVRQASDDDHQWGQWREATEYTSERRCLRCGEVEEE